MSDPATYISGDKLARLGAEPDGLRRLRRGIEKESLRITPDGKLSQRPHPAALGSPLTHPRITTDFSEAQLELITGVHETAADCLTELGQIHNFVFHNIGDEMMWPSSMPCLLGRDEDIPIGQYGSSNIGQAKTVYRRGLGVRYGRLMQTISGIHYNFSLPDEVWQQLGIHDQDGKTAAYFSLIRNFRRWSWLLVYLFGASPAVCKSFARDLDHNLQPFDEGSLYLPHATSLRMGPLGYQSSAQTTLHISYNSLPEYAQSMVEALTTQYPEYVAAGVKKNGAHQQLNAAVLQIENEFYGTIRPKRTTASGERPITALKARGVEYVEVRCIDLNPFLPMGIDAEQIAFLDTFLLLCLLADSEPDSQDESRRLATNQQTVVEQGRDPLVMLKRPNGEQVALTNWADELLAACQPVAELMDEVSSSTHYSSAWQTQQARLDDPSLTPSAQVLAEMQQLAQPFFRFSMNRAQEIKETYLSDGLPAELATRYAQTSRDSVTRQQEIEAADSEDFETFLQGYLALPG
ncbi:MAG: glutamate--cysteine ligase [Pseudomonadales bacterium]